MRKISWAAITLATSMATLFAAAAGPAAADPARASIAGVNYGLSASGLLAIAPTITTQAAFPPGGDNSVSGNFGTPSPTLLSLPLGNLAIAGVVGVEANAHQADDITPTLASVANTPGTSSPVTQSPDNTRSLARTTGLRVLISTNAAANPIVAALQALTTDLVNAQAVTSEAVAKCVNGKPVFNTGYQVAGLGGIVGAPVDTILQPILQLLTTALGRTAVLSDIASISAGEVTALPDGVAIDGLVVRVPLLGNETIVISHSEVHMPADCAVVVAKQPTGPGPVAPVAARLASTGSDFPFLPVGLAMVGVAVIGGGTVRRSRRRTAVQ